MSEHKRSQLFTAEDWWVVWFGFLIIVAALTGVVTSVPKLGKWVDNPLDVFLIIRDGVASGNIFGALVALWLGLGALTAIGVWAMGGKPLRYFFGYSAVFVFAVASYSISHQQQIRAYGLEYAFWGLLIGLLISNTVGSPSWLLAGAKSEMFIKTGLVLLGAEILFDKILKLGPPGLFVAWLVAPTVIILMYIFGLRWLKMTSKSLVMVIAAETSVCGVSAAIATAAACRAKKEELTLAVGMGLIFTVLMMIAMPLYTDGLVRRGGRGPEGTSAATRFR